MEWIDPRYADLVKAMKQASAERERAGEPAPTRGFIVQPKA
jgi:hypothetical protein